MQKFFGFDSTIGIGRNFGFKTEPKPPLEKPVITSIGEDVDMGGVRLEFAQFGDFDSFTVYRSDTPIDIASLPAPIAAGLTTMYYVDSAIVDQQDYYYRVGVVRDGEELVSDEMQYIPPPVASAIPTDYIFAYDFNGDVLDKSLNAVDGIRSGNTVFAAGRKVGTQALEFINGNVKTSKVMPINSDKLTASFWVSTSQSSASFIYEQDTGGYGLWCGINIYSKSQIESSEQSIYGGSRMLAPMPFNNTYQHVLIEIDRSKPASEKHKIYINNILNSKQSGGAPNSNGRFSNLVLFIGSSRSGSEPFVGKIQDMRFYNRVLTEVERTQLFNE